MKNVKCAITACVAIIALLAINNGAKAVAVVGNAEFELRVVNNIPLQTGATPYIFITPNMSTQRQTTLETNERLNKQIYIIPCPTSTIPDKRIHFSTVGKGGHQYEIYAALATAGNTVEHDLGAQVGEIMNRWIGEVTESSFVGPTLNNEWTVGGRRIRCIIGDPVRDGTRASYVIPVVFTDGQ